MSELELQEEEREALSSIYEGDDLFKQIDKCTYQYKYGEHDTNKSFVLEIKWGEQYPNELPVMNMDTFYNHHIVTSLKQKIVEMLRTEAEQYLGMSMTYSLFEFLKEKFDELINEQPDEPEKLEVEKLCISEEGDQQENQRKEKKEQLTKAQKRRQWNRVDAKGEKPRGWNWMDIVKHLSQTGPKEEQPIT
ncbi:unnamed protein product [Diabrotica balteata]|uniref:RWD domain-containing protein n=1 Tax=Diabrotica balteata TaxID=107213 RepID=A0A9N9SYP2_DIABA|nr:unnamed protein product [Diabrotica balteata]